MSINMGVRRALFPTKAHPALMAAWAAIVAAGHVLPVVVFPIFGTSSTFSLAQALSPLSGIFFGPIVGALCSAVGGYIGNLLMPPTAWMGPATFIITATTAFTAGCIAWGHWPPIKMDRNGHLIINGGIIVYLIGTILWFTQDIGRSIALYPIVFYGLGFIALIVGSLFARKAFSGKNVFSFPALWLCAFGGMVGGATIGNFFHLLLFKLPRETWMLLVLTSPIERVLFSLGTTVIGVPLLFTLPKIGIMLGPQPEEELPDINQG